MEDIKFTKYDNGAYHWRQYVRGDKYRAHADLIKKWVKEKKILDVGAGDGLLTYLLGAQGIDNEPKAIEIATALGVNVVLGSAYDLSFGDDSFEAVTMFDVIEHLGRPEQALAEARRVAPVLYISTPERGMVNDKFHVKEWTRDEFPIFMEENGWFGTMTVVPEHKVMYGRFNRNPVDNE